MPTKGTLKGSRNPHNVLLNLVAFLEYNIVNTCEVRREDGILFMSEEPGAKTHVLCLGDISLHYEANDEGTSQKVRHPHHSSPGFYLEHHLLLPSGQGLGRRKPTGERSEGWFPHYSPRGCFLKVS